MRRVRGRYTRRATQADGGLSPVSGLALGGRSTGNEDFAYTLESCRRDPPGPAEVAELADAQASGACSRKGVEVRALSSAPLIPIARWTSARFPVHAWPAQSRSGPLGIPPLVGVLRPLPHNQWTYAAKLCNIIAAPEVPRPTGSGLDVHLLRGGRSEHADEAEALPIQRIRLATGGVRGSTLEGAALLPCNR